MKFVFVTGNISKFKEAERILKEYDVIIEHKDIECEEIRAESCEEVALSSLRSLRSELNEPFFVEDSGLFIKALNEFPGTLSSWVFKKIGNGGILKLMRGEKDRDACFISSIAAWDGKTEKIFNGEVNGRISSKLMGESGFGYDPIFIPQGSEKSFAEDQKIKMQCSHRRRALEQLGEWLRR